MQCKYCKIEMDAVCLGECNGWKCSKCGHTEVESGSYKMAGEPPIFDCGCRNCARPKAGLKIYMEVTFEREWLEGESREELLKDMEADAKIFADHIVGRSYNNTQIIDSIISTIVHMRTPATEEELAKAREHLEKNRKG